MRCRYANCLAYMLPGGTHVIAEEVQRRELESQAQARPMTSSLHYEPIPVLEQPDRAVDIAVGARRVCPRDRQALGNRGHALMWLDRRATTQQAFLPRKINDRGRMARQQQQPHALTKQVRPQPQEAGQVCASVPLVEGPLRDLVVTVARRQACLGDIRRDELVDVSESVSDVQVVRDQPAGLREPVLLVMHLGQQQRRHGGQRRQLAVQQGSRRQRALVYLKSPCRVANLEESQAADAVLKNLAKRPLSTLVLLVQRGRRGIYAGTIIVLAARRQQRTRGGDLHVGVGAVPRRQPLLAGLARAGHVVTDKQHHHFTVGDLGGNVFEVDVLGDRPAPTAPLVQHALEAIQT